MVGHAVRIAAICVCSLICVFIPFLPGSYDSLAVIVSAIVQLMGFIALLLVPIGIAWFVYERTKRKRGEHAAQRSHRFGIAALVVLSLAVIVSSVAAFGGVGSYRGSALLGVGLLLCYIFIVFSIIIPKLVHMKNAATATKQPSQIPFYLIIIPLVVVIARAAFITPATEYSRSRAIEQSAILIGHLETYYDQHGRYPVSLQGLWKDYYPGVIGIEKYDYEPNGDAYNVFFEQFTYDFTAREMVMYNKRDEHVIRSHPSFLFVLPPDQFAEYRGYFAEHDLPNPHWKMFWFD